MSTPTPAPKKKFRVVKLLLLTLVVGGVGWIVLSSALHKPEQKVELPAEVPAELPIDPSAAPTDPGIPPADPGLPPAIAPVVHPDPLAASAAIKDPTARRAPKPTEATQVEAAVKVLEGLLGEGPLLKKIRETKKEVFTRPHYFTPVGSSKSQPVLGMSTDDAIVLSPELFRESFEGFRSRLLVVLIEEAYYLLDNPDEKVEAEKLGKHKSVDFKLRPKLLSWQLLKQLKDAKVPYEFKLGLGHTQRVLAAEITTIDPNVLK